MIDKSPMGRLGTTQEVAALALWLCSDSCTFNTGATFDLSGGRATY
jgi:3-oxoacyl-[acyl-carrier protein] reductase